MVLRDVVYVEASTTKTSRRNPESYIVIFSCGHGHCFLYRKEVSLLAVAFGKGLKPNRNCGACTRKEKVALWWLQEKCPSSVWRQQNFDRFLSRPISYATEKGVLTYVPSDEMMGAEKKKCLICGKPIEETSPSNTFCLKDENINAKISLCLAGGGKTMTEKLIVDVPDLLSKIPQIHCENLSRPSKESESRSENLTEEKML